jgi:DNA-binding transcriptional LysR family regulator
VRVSLRQLQIFAAIADSGSTVAAGRRVALSQSAASGALSELERMLGAPLFDRVGKRLVLNDDGRALLPRARALLDSATGLEQDFGVDSGAPSGTRRLRLAASTTIGNYLLPPLIASYRRKSPETRVDVQVGNTREASEAVTRLEVDLGLIEGASRERDLVVEPWIVDELVIVAAPGHPLLRDPRSSGSRRLGIRALRDVPWLLREPGSGTREAVEQALLPHLHQWHDETLLGSTEAIMQGAAAGLGFACLSRYAVRDLVALGRLRVVNTTLPRITRHLYLIRHRAKELTARLQAFAEHCQTDRQPDLE